MKHLARILILLPLILFTLMSVFPVQACSGGGSDYIEALLERTQYAVKAEVVRADALRQNGILHVDSYLYGGAGPEYLLFLQNDPASLNRELEGDVYDNCTFFQQELVIGQTGYFFLERRADGVYVTTTNWIDPDFYVFPDPDATVNFSSRDGEDFVQHKLTESEFVEFIITFGQSQPTEPDDSFPYPRLSLLKITSEGSLNYVLPVDNAIPIEVTEAFLQEMTLNTMGYDSTHWNEAAFSASNCPGDGCVGVSPDGINRAVQDSDEIRWFGGSATGQAFLFSSTGDAIAVWNGSQLEIYTLGWDKSDQDFSEVTLLNSVNLGGDPLPYQAAWSPDGRRLAYSDAGGLWLIDAYNPSHGLSLLLAADSDGIPLALQFSPLGRYLQIERGGTRFTIDTLTGDLFPDGLVSPDDQLLLAYDTTSAVFDMQICYLAPIRDCEPMRATIIQTGGDESDVYNRFTQVMWRNRYSFIAAACERDEPERCIVDRHYSIAYGGSWYSGNYWSEGYTFDYLPLGDSLAVVRDAYTVDIDGQTYDFFPMLNSRIVRVEWLPPLFNGE